MALDIGRIAYQKHKDVILERAKQPLPEWEEIGQIHQDAWRHAAVAVIHYFDDLKNQDPELIG